MNDSMKPFKIWSFFGKHRQKAERNIFWSTDEYNNSNHWSWWVEGEKNIGKSISVFSFAGEEYHIGVQYIIYTWGTKKYEHLYRNVNGNEMKTGLKAFHFLLFVYIHFFIRSAIFTSRLAHNEPPFHQKIYYALEFSSYFFKDIANKRILSNLNIPLFATSMDCILVVYSAIIACSHSLAGD